MTALSDGESMNVSGILFFSFFIFGPFLAGFVIRIRREREHLLVQERDERARAAVAEERTRIARELHDVVAHAMGVIVLQARGARHAMDAAPDDARGAIDAIESTAGTALAEMRQLLGVLREDSEEIAFAPQPSLAHLDVLAAKLREAGLPVEVTVDGETRELPPGVDLSAYRIVQEALTNALKHAGPARARVHLRYRPDHVEVEVLDDGDGGSNGGGSGHGLLGMHERVSVFGGELETGPRDGGGYAVRARLPL
jgi:signal transduction histidine kinase